MSRFRPSLTATKAPALPRSSPGQTPMTSAVATLRPASPRLVQPGAQPAAPAATGGLLVALVGIYISMHVTPVAEVLNVITGSNLRVAVLTGLLVGIGVILSGEVGRFWNTLMGKIWTALLVLYVLASFLGDWRGMSVPFIGQYAIRFHAIPFLVCAAAQSGAQVRRLMFWAAGGGLLLVLLSIRYGLMVDGRFIISGIPSLENPNDLAFLLLFGAVFLMFVAYANHGLFRVIALIALPMIVYFVIKSGSRANFLTLLSLVAVVLFIAPRRIKMAVVALAPAFAVAMLLLVPSATLQRLTLILLNPTRADAVSDSRDVASAIGSQVARKQLQERAIELTLRHPLLGVGPMMFADAVDAMVREQTGTKSGWQSAHNVYLQVAAENGLLAFALFVFTICWCLKTSYQVYKASRARGDLSAYLEQSFCLLLLIVAYGFGILFCNIIYDAGLPIVVGLTAANHLAFTKDMQLATI